MEIVLASTSRYRVALLQRLGLRFRQAAPETDETPLPGESPAALAERLAVAKAQSVAARHPAALVIGSDQVAALGKRILGKPGTLAAAREQLSVSSGRDLRFYTAVALACAGRGLLLRRVVPFTVAFRTLSEQEIEDYLRREQPFDCAGSFRWEGLGIALFRSLRGEDPTALEGLPLIALCELLREAGVEVLGEVGGSSDS